MFTACSPDIASWEFWLLGYLKGMIYQTDIWNLNETLKQIIAFHVSTIREHVLHSVVEHRMQRLEKGRTTFAMILWCKIWHVKLRFIFSLFPHVIEKDIVC